MGDLEKQIKEGKKVDVWIRIDEKPAKYMWTRGYLDEDDNVICLGEREPNLAVIELPGSWVWLTDTASGMTGRLQDAMLMGVSEIASTESL